MPACVSWVRARAGGLALPRALVFAVFLVASGGLMPGGGVLAAGPALAASDPAPVPLVPLEALEIATAKGVVMLEVEVARTEAERTTGLMYRKSLGERHGMLFDFEEDQPVYMWMKNTYIPLDMLFIRADGSIARIAAMTTPLSTEVISSGEPVRAVLEIAGGAAKRLGIAPGDKVAHPLLPKR